MGVPLRSVPEFLERVVWGVMSHVTIMAHSGAGTRIAVTEIPPGQDDDSGQNDCGSTSARV